MARKLPKVDVVIVGVGWGGGVIASELTRQGLTVVGLERGKERKTEDYFMVHDELRYALRYEMMQDLSKETITFRSNPNVRALPMRSYGSFCWEQGLAARAFTGMATRSGFCRMISRFTARQSSATGKRKFPRA